MRSAKPGLGCSGDTAGALPGAPASTIQMNEVRRTPLEQRVGGETQARQKDDQAGCFKTTIDIFSHGFTLREIRERLLIETCSIPDIRTV